MAYRFTTFIVATLLYTSVTAQNASISGVITHQSEPVFGATIFVYELGRGTRTNAQGEFLLQHMKAGNYTLRVNFTGYKSIEQQINILDGEKKRLNFELESDVFNQSEVVVSATRNQLRRQDAPVIVNTISNRTFEATQSLSLAEGLSFSPGFIENMTV